MKRKSLDVYLSQTARKQYLSIIEFLTLEWPTSVLNNFEKKFDDKVHQIALDPKSCVESSVKPDIFKAVVEKHISFYYRIKNDEIEILIVLDNRQNPDKTKDSLRQSL